VRRIEAIATSKGVDPDQLADRLRLCFRVPRLAVPDAGSELGCHMGAVLQAIQGVCQTAECALLLVTHWNKTGDGRGADRISGAGPAAWARVICSVAILHRGSDPDEASTVLLGVELIGGEIADTRFALHRRVRADDPANLGSPLSYAVEVLADDDPENLDPAAAA
jgi:hypothetical protein